MLSPMMAVNGRSVFKSNKTAIVLPLLSMPNIGTTLPKGVVKFSLTGSKGTVKVHKAKG
jgi:hypothetical protein